MALRDAVLPSNEQDVTDVITGRRDGRSAGRVVAWGALLWGPALVASAVLSAGIWPHMAAWIAPTAAVLVALAMLRQAARWISMTERHDTLAANLGLDAETRLPGARALHEVLADATAEAQRSGRPVSVLMVSVDDLRPLMVDRGLDAGARVWRQVAAGVAGVVGVEGGRAFRLHGQAVVAVLPDASLAKAERVAARILPSLSLAARRNGGLFKGTVGAAVALAGDLPEDVLLRAELQCARQRSGKLDPPVPMLRAVPPQG